MMRSDEDFSLFQFGPPYSPVAAAAAAPTAEEVEEDANEGEGEEDANETALAGKEKEGSKAVLLKKKAVAKVGW